MENVWLVSSNSSKDNLSSTSEYQSRILEYLGTRSFENNSTIVFLKYNNRV